MEDTASATFKFKGLSFSYSPSDSTFCCDAKSMLYVLSTYFPAACADAVKLDSCLETLAADLKSAKDQLSESDRNQLDSEWKSLKDKESSAQAETNVTEVEEDEKTAPLAAVKVEASGTGSRKPGMISRISKGIRKIIAKLTPTKLHKRLHLTEDS